MENNQTVFDYVTYKFYDEKNRRLSIFGKYDAESRTMGIYVITCSKKDLFSKDFAKEQFKLYISGDYTHMECNIDPHEVLITNGKPKATFLDFCKSKYHRKRERLLRLDITGIKVEQLKVKKFKLENWLVINEMY